MTKFHINPSTGRPDVCNASKRACPIGETEDHFGSRNEAIAAYEMRMSDSTIPSSVARDSEISSKTANNDESDVPQYNLRVIVIGGDAAKWYYTVILYERVKTLGVQRKRVAFKRNYSTSRTTIKPPMEELRARARLWVERDTGLSFN